MLSVIPRLGSLSQCSVFVALALAGVAGFALVYLLDPREPSVYPVCPFLGLTGCYCPGCGTLRALHQALHGNIGAALGYNTYAILALPVIAYSYAVAGLRTFGLPSPPRMFIPAEWIWALLAAVLAFWLLRNLPFGPFPVLAP